MEKIRRAEAKRSLNEEEEEEDEDIGGGEGGFGDQNQHEKMKKKKGKKGSSTSSSTGALPCCQVENCTTDMSDAKRYHKRHKVCEFHAKASVVSVHGLHQRFCQQCSRFHPISEFDEAKRSCRMRLAGHNERRRKTSSENHGEGSS